MTNIATKPLNIKPVFISVAFALCLQGCALPNIKTRDVTLAMPTAYTQAPPDEAIDIDWDKWFDDKHLVALIDTALENNQEAAVMLQRINMAANEVYAREGEYLPQVSAAIETETEKVGEFTREGAVEKQLPLHEDDKFPDPLAKLKLGLNASWELDVWHKLRNASKVASLEYLASIEYRKFFVTQLVAEVSKTYYELLALDNRLTNLDATIHIQQHVLNTLEQLKIYGRTSALPITRFSAEVSKNQSERFLIQQEIIETENKLNLLLGRTPQNIPRNSSQFMTASLHQPTIGVPSALLENRADIRQAELELTAAKLDIQVAKANFYPSLTLKAGVGLASFNSKYLLDTPESLTYSLSADMFAPLINRRAIEAVYKNASAQQIQAAYDYEYTVIRAISEVSTQFTKLNNLAQSYASKNKQIQSLEKSVGVANQLFSSARGEYLEVLLAQREALEARGELIDMRKQQLTALVELYQALGGGWKS